MNPYQAFPRLSLPPSAGPSAPESGGVWSSVLILRLISAAEALARAVMRAGRAR